MKYLKYFESNSEFRFEEESIGWHHGQQDLSLKMYSKDNILLAQVDYVIYQGKISISFIESFIKGRGYGQELMKELSKKYGYENLERGALTEDGVKMRNKLDKFYNFDYNVYLQSKNKHLSEDIISKIKDVGIKEFLKYLINLGYKEAWEILVNTDDFYRLKKEYDLNDIAEISEWIKYSKTNDHYIENEPPENVLELLDKLCK